MNNLSNWQEFVVSSIVLMMLLSLLLPRDSSKKDNFCQYKQLTLVSRLGSTYTTSADQICLRPIFYDRPADDKIRHVTLIITLI